MNIRIVRKDLKRKKSINLILLVFIFLSTMFIAGSLNNFLVIVNGVEHFMEAAQMKDYLIVTMGGSPEEISENDRTIEDFLNHQEEVENYTVDDNLFLTENQVKKENGQKIVLSGSIILNRFDIHQQKFFDKENQEITAMEPDSIYIGQGMAEKNHLKTGDALRLCSEDGYEKTFQVAGELKDAFLGSDMMGTNRVVISPKDFEEMKKESGLPYGRLYSVSCRNVEKFQAEYNGSEFSELFGADKNLVKTTYVMEMVIAAVILLVSFCLIIISVVMLRFTIVFTVNEDYKEIGIMKAIGMRDGAIRRIYVMKYAVLALAGALCGFAASIPFSRGLLLQVTEKIVMEEKGDKILLPLLVSLLVMSMIILFAYHSTGKMKKFSPMDAIRSGNNGERFRKKGIFHLKNLQGSPTTFLACNDVLSEMKKYLVLFFASMIGVWLVVMPVNTINTLNSDGISAWFGLTECDFYVEDNEKVAELMVAGTKQEWYDYLEETEELLQDHNMKVENVCTEVFFKFRVRKGDKSYKSFAIQGLGTATEQYFYDEGQPPLYENEIALTHIVAEKIGAKLGDTVYVVSGNQEKPYIVTALYQSMNNMGEGIRFTEDAVLDYRETAGGFGLQVSLKEEVNEKELSDIIQKVQKWMPEASVKTTKDFINGMVGNISGRLGPLKLLILAVVLSINILVVVLMQKMFLIRERGEIGMLKSIGFSNGAVILWQTKRMVLVLVFGILAGTLTGTPFSELTSGQVFQMMGAEKIEFMVNPLEIYLVYPAVLFLASLAACIIVMQRVRSISVQEMNQIE